MDAVMNESQARVSKLELAVQKLPRLEKLVEGDDEAWETAYPIVADLVVSEVRKFGIFEEADQQDIAQDVFARLNCRWAELTINDAEHFLRILQRTARYVTLDFLRGRKKECRYLAENNSDLCDTDIVDNGDTMDEFSKDELTEMLTYIEQRLTPNEYKLFRLLTLTEINREVADVMGKSPSTVQYQVKQLKIKIRKLKESYGKSKRRKVL
jgi:RNA polymerase sigma factor (sigma-70 family)